MMAAVLFDPGSDINMGQFHPVMQIHGPHWRVYCGGVYSLATHESNLVFHTSEGPAVEDKT